MNIPRPKVPMVRVLIEAYYTKPGNDSGGCCHVVLEDDNLDDPNLRFCLEYCLKKGDEEGAHIMRLMTQMSRSQRRRVLFDS